LVPRENVALQVVLSLLQLRALLAQTGSLLLQLGQLGSQLPQSNVFLTTLTACFIDVAIEKLLLMLRLTLIKTNLALSQGNLPG